MSTSAGQAGNASPGALPASVVLQSVTGLSRTGGRRRSADFRRRVALYNLFIDHAEFGFEVLYRVSMRLLSPFDTELECPA